MKKISFRARLVLSFSILLFVSISIVIMSGYQIHMIGKDSELIYNHPFMVSNAARDIKININAIHRTMKDVVLSENEEQLYECVELVNTYDSIILASFDLIQERFLGDKRVVLKTRQFYTDWEIIRNEVITLKQSGEDGKAAFITKNKGAWHVVELNKKTSYLIDFAKSKADIFYAETIKREKESTIFLLIVALSLLVIGIAISFLVSRSISKPIHDFIRDVKILYQKEDDYSAVSDKSEEEILRATAVELREAYNMLSTFNQELDRQVAERTLALEKSKLQLIDQYKEISALNDEYSAQNEEYLALNEEYRTQNEELRKAKDRAEESDRLKSAFLANMSHEIRTPLNSILGFSEVLKMGGLTESDKERYLDLIISGGHGLLGIISDIVDISKINANQLKLKRENCNLNKIIDHLYYQFSVSKVNQNVELKSIKPLDDELSIVYSDRNRLMQILSNLIENAMKFTIEGEVRFGYVVDKDRVRLFVSDTGVGIDEQDKDRIFDRFVRVDNKRIENRSGTGLGLSIVKGLLDLLDSEIHVESEVNKGTTFQFEIPFQFVEPNEELKERKMEKIAIETNKDVVVLIADDEDVNFMYLEAVLRPYKFKVIHAENGKRAVEIFKEQKRIDIILMDIKMPEMTGLEATREIRKINTKTPIIAQSAYAMSEDRDSAMASGCTDFIAKPITYQQVKEVITKYIK